MSNSLYFCKNTASDRARSCLYDRSWDDAYEINSESLFDRYIDGERRLVITGNRDGISFKNELQLTFDPNYEFQYFTSESCVHDGTLLFVSELIEKCVQKVCCLITYYKPNGIIPNGCCVKCVVGNFVILNEYDEQGSSFRSLDKPWMMTRTTVLLPIFMEYANADKENDQ